jgi:hypothetical protein
MQKFRGNCHLQLWCKPLTCTGDGSIMFMKNTNIYLANYTLSHPRECVTSHHYGSLKAVFSGTSLNRQCNSIDYITMEKIYQNNDMDTMFSTHIQYVHRRSTNKRKKWQSFCTDNYWWSSMCRLYLMCILQHSINMD